MQVIWYSESCFKIISSETSILTDPFSPAAKGFKKPRITSEITLFSNPSILKKKETEGNNFFLISTPGEYEIKNIFIFGLPHFEENVFKIIYKIEIEGIRICFLGEISKSPSPEELKKLGKIDIFFLPFNKNLLPLKELVKMIKEMEQKIIIPHSLEIKEGKTNLKIIDGFIKEIGWRKFEKVDKLKIRKKNFSSEKTELIVLEPTIK